jgi:hypothetical protein
MRHDLGMELRVHPKYKTKYRVNNWAEYDKSLVQRGDITLWISVDAITSWKPTPTGQRGAQRKFSDHAIETALTLRLIFKLPLRQAEGFLRSVLSVMNVALEAPDHTTLSRRSQHLNTQLVRVPTKEPIHLIIDSTGLSIVGEGEWAAAKYGERGRRGWKKLHLRVDRTGVIVAPRARAFRADPSQSDRSDTLAPSESGAYSSYPRRASTTSSSRSVASSSEPDPLRTLGRSGSDTTRCQGSRWAPQRASFSRLRALLASSDFG